ncbi:transposase [SAR92 clade bacterium H455]|uniref:Transposase n=1 Tax=SAR92 clade bacterium H455 TaxID=2974818 RepID=A0ABY5TJY0_9GAMM|nr:transposase [SAR92 clade bacterium H455]
MSKVNALYRLERQIKDLPADEKYRQRQKLAIPMLNNLKSWLDKNISGVVKGELTYKAIYYGINQWDKLVRYCEDGRLNISNANAENAIRPFSVGRRRWLFSDTPKGDHASAIHYGMVETVKTNGLVGIVALEFLSLFVLIGTIAYSGPS